MSQPQPHPLIVLLGPTASGKTALSLALAQHGQGEILSCDSIAVYRGMDLGSAKPTSAERALIPHHGLDLYDPPEPATAGAYARYARRTLAEIASRNQLPILTAGTGLYLRALLDGLSPTPPANPALRTLLRLRAARRSSTHLHRTLTLFDPTAAARIHPHDTPKLIRAIELSLLARRPATAHLTQHPPEPLQGFRILRLGLTPPRPELYRRIDQRAADMFDRGLLDETRALIRQFGPACRPFQSLGYAQAAVVLRNELTIPEAIAQAQQGHRNYAKRQLTWFRRESELHPVHWLSTPGDTPEALAEARTLIAQHLGAA